MTRRIVPGRRSCSRACRAALWPKGRRTRTGQSSRTSTRRSVRRCGWTPHGPAAARPFGLKSNSSSTNAKACRTSRWECGWVSAGDWSSSTTRSSGPPPRRPTVRSTGATCPSRWEPRSAARWTPRCTGSPATTPSTGRTTPKRASVSASTSPTSSRPWRVRAPARPASVSRRRGATRWCRCQRSACMAATGCQRRGGCTAASTSCR